MGNCCTKRKTSERTALLEKDEENTIGTSVQQHDEVVEENDVVIKESYQNPEDQFRKRSQTVSKSRGGHNRSMSSKKRIQTTPSPAVASSPTTPRQKRSRSVVQPKIKPSPQAPPTHPSQPTIQTTSTKKPSTTVDDSYRRQKQPSKKKRQQYETSIGAISLSDMSDPIISTINLYIEEDDPTIQDNILHSIYNHYQEQENQQADGVKTFYKDLFEELDMSVKDDQFQLVQNQFEDTSNITFEKFNETFTDVILPQLSANAQAKAKQEELERQQQKKKKLRKKQKNLTEHYIRTYLDETTTTSDQKHAIEALFNVYSRNQDVLTLEQFKDVFCDIYNSIGLHDYLKHSFKKIMVDAFIDLFPISFASFVAVFEKSIIKDIHHQIEKENHLEDAKSAIQLFEDYMSSETKTIHKTKFMSFLSHLFRHYDIDVPKSQLELYFNEIDTDSSGEVSLDEFKRFYQSAFQKAKHSNKK
mmetsp:Transcript_13995/g.21186  ORF Transcript_13995/g.21186 Transcript_13995/m.21186 type:complete len:473 (-) Transcript_13995:23-1441(-)